MVTHANMVSLVSSIQLILAEVELKVLYSALPTQHTTFIRTESAYPDYGNFYIYVIFGYP